MERFRQPGLAHRRSEPAETPTRLSVWALIGGGVALCIGIVSLLTFEFYLEEGEEISADALSDLFDLVVTGAFIGLIIGVVHRLVSRLRRYRQRLRARPRPR
jgi:hypothetical protein